MRHVGRNKPENQRAASARFRARHPEVDVFGHILRTYGITREEFASMLIAQAGRCAVEACREPLVRKNEPAIDHQHTTGWKKMAPSEKRQLVRALLCHLCNTALNAKGSPELHRSRAAYLEAHS